MSTEMLSPQAYGSRVRESTRLAELREENIELLARLNGLRAALEVATRESAELRRELARLQAENEHLRGVGPIPSADPPTGHADRMARIRVMLRDQHSRNP